MRLISCGCNKELHFVTLVSMLGNKETMLYLAQDNVVSTICGTSSCLWLFDNDSILGQFCERVL